ncbi:MAG: isochorismatase family protein [Gluconacetobacter diazotrophicus]|nr:isochorismatase family protein [Gluconacetobacter diazotrophicus]
MSINSDKEKSTPALQLDPAATALVLIDLQRAIVARPLAPHPTSEVVARAAGLAAAFRARGATVAYVHVDLADMLHLPVDQPTMDPNAPKPPPEASELVPESGYQPGSDLLFTKRQWGAFYDTGLDQQLRRRGVDTIVLAGIATSFGVESTARAAFDLGYKVVFVEDAMTGPSAEAHRLAVEHVFPRMGRVRGSSEVLAVLAGETAAS